MKRFFLGVLIFLASAGLVSPSFAQVTYATVTATITDPTGNPFANAAYSISLVNAQGYPVSSATTPNGSLFNTKPVYGNLDANGFMSVQLAENSILSKPSGTQWAISVSYPQDSAILLYQPPWTINYTVSVTANVDLSAPLSALSQPINFLNLKTGQSTLISTQGCAGGNTIAHGCTGGTTQSTARSSLGAAASGANSDITSLTGLTTPLSTGQGGTGNTTGTAQHALNLPADFATQSAISPNVVNGTNGNFSGTFAAAIANIGIVNSVINVDAQSGGDIGAKINSSVALCSSTCTYNVAVSGVISTAPNLPLGSTIRFNPTGTYTLSVPWLFQHRGISAYFDNAKINCTLDAGASCIYVGKGASSIVNISGTAVTWVSGSTFAVFDAGDQIEYYSGGTQYSANVAVVNSPTSITLTASGGSFSGIPMVGYIVPQVGQGAYPGQGPSLYGLNIIGTGLETNPADMALEIEMVTGAMLTDYHVTNFVSGTGLYLSGVQGLRAYNTNCNVTGNCVVFDQNNLGGFFVSGSNADDLFGLSCYASPLATGQCFNFKNQSYSSTIYALWAEGNSCSTNLGKFGATNDKVVISDWERNGLCGADIAVTGSNNIIEGDTFESSTSGYGILISTGTSANVIRDLNISGAYTAGAINFQGTSTGRVINVTDTASGSSASILPPGGVEDTLGNYRLSSATINNPTTYAISTSAVSSLNFGLGGYFGPSAGPSIQAYYASGNTIGYKFNCMYGAGVVNLCAMLDPTGSLTIGSASGGSLSNQNGILLPSTATGNTGSSTGKVSLVPGPEAFGYGTLTSGTLTVSNAAACTPSATCIYKLTNCLKNASAGIGYLSVGTVSVGASFVINSLGPTASVLTTDASSICWQIN